MNENENEKTNIIEFEKKNTPPQEDVPRNELPEALTGYRTRLSVAALVFFAVAITIFAVTKHFAASIIFLLFTAYYCFLIFNMKKEFRRGEIKEVQAECVNIVESRYKGRLCITFAGQNEEGQKEYYKFVMQDKRKSEDFLIGARYVIYFSLYNPSFLMASLPL